MTILVFLGVGLAVSILIGLVLYGQAEAERMGGYDKYEAIVNDHNEGR